MKILLSISFLHINTAESTLKIKFCILLSISFITGNVYLFLYQKFFSQLFSISDCMYSTLHNLKSLSIKSKLIFFVPKITKRIYYFLFNWPWKIQDWIPFIFYKWKYAFFLFCASKVTTFFFLFVFNEREFFFFLLICISQKG